jgi:hypothetical protein
MHSRSRQLADRVAEQLDLTARFVAGLEDRELTVSCRDEGGGPTVGAVILHVVAGFRRASAMFAAARGGPEARNRRTETPATSAGRDRTGDYRAADLGRLDVSAALRLLRVEGDLAVATLRRLPDAALDEPLPLQSCSIADVGKPVSLVVEFIVYQQAGHLDMMERAVTAGRAARH